MQISATMACGLMLVASNVFMTFAWYAHLKELSAKPWWIAALASWGIALFEYLLMVPANRLGHGQFTAAQLKIAQESITIVVFLGFAWLWLGETPRWNEALAFGLVLAAVAVAILPS